MAGEYAPSTFVERRSGRERRSRPTSPFTLRSLYGSRRYGRRKEDRALHYYVDRYGIRSVTVLVVSLVLCLADAFMTIHLLSLGAQELNPVMDFFIQMGPVPFLLVKYSVTGIALIWLLIHKNYPLMGGRFTGKGLLMGVPVIYALLVVYELFLAFVLIPSA